MSDLDTLPEGPLSLTYLLPIEPLDEQTEAPTTAAEVILAELRKGGTSTTSALAARSGFGHDYTRTVLHRLASQGRVERHDRRWRAVSLVKLLPLPAAALRASAWAQALEAKHRAELAERNEMILHYRRIASHFVPDVDNVDPDSFCPP